MNNSITRSKYPLHPRKIIKKTISQVFFWIFSLFIFGLVASFAFSDQVDINNLIGVFVSIILRFILPASIIMVVVSALYQYWYFLTYYYELGEEHCTIRKGPITPTEVVITYDRIQDIYVDQDVLDRILGIYDVHISTATVASGIHAHIDGVERDAAYGLRDQFLYEVKKRKGNNQGL